MAHVEKNLKKLNFVSNKSCCISDEKDHHWYETCKIEKHDWLIAHGHLIFETFFDRKCSSSGPRNYFVVVELSAILVTSSETMEPVVLEQIGYHRTFVNVMHKSFRFQVSKHELLYNSLPQQVLELQKVEFETWKIYLMSTFIFRTFHFEL